MKYQLLVLVVMLAGVSCWRLRRATVTAGNDDDDDPNFDPATVKDLVCVAKNNQTGICVNERECNEDHTVVPGGIIEDTDIRAGNCPGQYDWCCTLDRTTRKPNVVHKKAEHPCVFDDLKTKGICVMESFCRSNATIEAGGVITDKDIRSKNCPPNEKCCRREEVTTEAPVVNATVNPLSVATATPTSKTITETSPTVTPPSPTVTPPSQPVTETDNKSGNMTPSTPTNPNCEGSNCPLTNTECPNCAAIYRIGGHPQTMSPSGLYCGGLILKSRVVLTSASCISAGKKKVVWIQVPGSTRPQKKYNVTATAKREGYNPGTKEYDIGLMLLEEDVTFAGSNANGLDIGPRYTLQATCAAVGYAVEDDKMTSTQLQIKSGSCTDRGNGIDAACGRTEGTCLVTPGSPVICPTGKVGVMAVAGVLKDRCDEGAAMLSNLGPSISWLQGHKWMTDNGIDA